jgi:hypothetical protein
MIFEVTGQILNSVYFVCTMNKRLYDSIDVMFDLFLVSCNTLSSSTDGKSLAFGGLTHRTKPPSPG